MWLTAWVLRNFANPKIFPWDKHYKPPGYRKTPISFAPGKRNLKYTIPVTPKRYGALLYDLNNEFQVMRCLSTPFLSKAEESVWFDRCGGNPNLIKESEATAVEQSRMPNKPKRLQGDYKRRGNVGNQLHQPVTLANHFDCLLDNKRWD